MHGLPVASITWPQVVAFVVLFGGAVLALAKLVPFLEWLGNRCPPKMEVHEVPPAPRNGNEGALVVYVRNHHTTALRAEAGVLLPSGDYTPLFPYRVEKVIYADVPARGGRASRVCARRSRLEWAVWPGEDALRSGPSSERTCSAIAWGVRGGLTPRLVS